MLEQRRLGHSLAFSPLPFARRPCFLACCSVETDSSDNSTSIRPQLRPKPRGKMLAGLSLYGARAYLHIPLAAYLFMWQYHWRPGSSRPGWPRQRACWVKPLACGTSDQNRPSPSGTLPGCFKRAVCKHSCRVYPQAVHSPPTSGRKSSFGRSSLRALGPEPGDQLGGPHAQAKSEEHAKVCSCPLHIQGARLRERVSGSPLAAPAAPPGWKGAELT